MTVVVGGSFFLQQFAQLRYIYNRKTQKVTEEEAKALNYKKDGFSLPEHLEVVVKEDLYSDEVWENIRGPRNWEGKEIMEGLQQKMKEVKEKQIKETHNVQAD